MSLNLLKKQNIGNKKVLLRSDFNVPIKKKALNHNGFRVKILDDSRIKESLPTIKFLLKRDNKIIIVSHLGRPKINQKSKFKNQKLVLKSIAVQIAKLLKLQITRNKLQTNLNGFSGYKIGKNIILLENIRFYPEEEKNDKNFARRLAGLADIFINDAFSVCHRAHASTVGVAKFLPSYAGFSLEKEVKAIDKIIKNPKKPLVCLIGGAKVETKLPLIKNFLSIANFVLVGGKIGFQKIPYHSKKLILPIDGADSSDIGPKTIALFIGIIKKAKTIFWNGTMGFFEDKKFAAGTKKISETIAKSKAFSVVGGGETILALKRFNLLKKISYLSLGGGATLEYLAGKKLPGIEVLMYKN